MSTPATEAQVTPAPAQFSLNALTKAFALAKAVLAEASCSPETRAKAAELESMLLEIDNNAQLNSEAIHIARMNYCSDDVEIDDNPIVSEGDSGTWVSAWVYVAKPDEDETEH